MNYEPVDCIHPGSTPVMVNASLMKKRSCDYAMYMMRQYKLRVDPEIPAFGTAIHEYCSTTDLTGNMAAGLAAAEAICPKNQKTQANLRGLAMSRPSLPTPIHDKHGDPCLETLAAIPWRRYNVDGKDFTIVLHGTLDRVIVNASNLLVVQDYKTSLYYKTEDALRKYEYEFQFEYYKWLLHEFGHCILTLPHANMAREFKLASQVIVAQCSSNLRWTLGPLVGWTQRKADLMQELVEGFIEEQLLPMLTSNYVAQNGMLCNACGQCDFNTICHTGNPDTAHMLLQTNFVEHVYGGKVLALLARRGQYTPTT